MKDDSKSMRGRLVVIQGGLGRNQEGPITRLGLWERLSFISNAKIAWFIFAKVILLSSVLYLIYG